MYCKDECGQYVCYFGRRLLDWQVSMAKHRLSDILGEHGIRADVTANRNEEDETPYTFKTCKVRSRKLSDLGWEQPCIIAQLENRLWDLSSRRTKMHVFGLKKLCMSISLEAGYKDWQRYLKYKGDVVEKYGRRPSRKNVMEIDRTWNFECELWTIRLSTDAKSRGYRCKTLYGYEPKEHYFYGRHLPEVLDRAEAAILDMIDDLDLFDAQEKEHEKLLKKYCK